MKTEHAHLFIALAVGVAVGFFSAKIYYKQ